MDFIFKMPENIISFEDWSKIDLRVGEIVEVEEIEGADKLWKLNVDLGDEIGKRTICAGLRQYYSKDELINKQIIVVVNLAPRKMRGVESQGMLLAAVNQDESQVVLISPDTLYPNNLKVTRGHNLKVVNEKGTSKEMENGAKVR